LSKNIEKTMKEIDEDPDMINIRKRMEVAK
jgi:hypothetical protein